MKSTKSWATTWMPRKYRLSDDADQDVRDIARHTATDWGLKKAQEYDASLHEHFETIGDGTAPFQRPLAAYPQLQLSRCREHRVFSIVKPNQSPLIIAVLHRKMDLLRRVQERLKQHNA